MPSGFVSQSDNNVTRPFNLISAAVESHRDFSITHNRSLFSPSEGRIGWGSCVFLNNFPSSALLDIAVVHVYQDARRAFDVELSSG